ncbi:hypothetical protein [Vibrio caribbeanicus]|uniref:Uncharacterized protein n=1 Tax=Vibrio caribbeanicus ATCC BAA-2122 TaxID=796620 RepID=E3BGP5_9VIBR|nr:hypothetical protein [Vibrio caribbeanicus]EFP97769.1 hypothetical protein VIBC2010_04464 [Vibrio caribbeanicus ATCC BAA-2122]
MTNDKLLEKFGQILMTEVRDKAIEKYEMIVSGRMKSAAAIEFNKQLSALSDDQLSLIREVVVNSIDDAIHNFLWVIEQHEDHVELICSEGASKANMNDISDGLSGEIYTENGWIALFSKYKENY